MRAVLYARVSATDRQDRRCNSRNCVNMLPARLGAVRHICGPDQRQSRIPSDECGDLDRHRGQSAGPHGGFVMDRERFPGRRRV